MVRWKYALTAALLGLCVALPAQAQWKWRGKDGQIQYSDLPPPAGVTDHDILQRPSPVVTPRAPAPAASAASAAPLLPAKASDPELEARRKQAEQEAADRKKADEAKNAAIKADNCARARDSLRTLDSGSRLARVNAKGEREYLDDAARVQESQRARDLIASQCTP